MLRKLGLSVALVILTFCAAQPAATAQCGGLYGAWGIYDVGRLYQVLSQNVPHFAAFPPVYYSLPVPRTYGYSPFAYPPGTMTPEIEIAPMPQEITNPHLAPAASETTSATADRVTSAPHSVQPLVVLNPYRELTESEFQTASSTR